MKNQTPAHRWIAALLAGTLALGAAQEALAQAAQVAVAAPAGVSVPAAAGAAAAAAPAQVPSLSISVVPSLLSPAPVPGGIRADSSLPVTALPAPAADAAARAGSARAAAAQVAAAAEPAAQAGPAALAASATPATPKSEAVRALPRQASGERGFLAAARRAANRFMLPAPAIAAAFDGARRAAADAEAEPAAGALDPAKIRVFLTRAGRDPIATDLASLAKELAADPQFVGELNRSGRVRMVVNVDRPGALSRDQADALRKALADQGVSARFDVESVPIDWSRKDDKKAQDVPAGQVSAGQGILSAAASPFKELLYLAHTLRAAATRPTVAEVIGGVVSKGPAFALSTMWWAKLFLPTHPVAFAVALGASFALQAFHGVWINTWQNFQQILSRQRGINYQAAFNFVYMQLTTAVFRFISWTVDKTTVMPWQLKYWRDISAANVVGTFVGVLGFYGLNDLYEKGIIPRSGRSWIQQGRDLFFLLAGTFMFSGSMGAFWVLFAVQQGIDLGLYALSRRMKARPAVYVADAAIADTDSFKSMYPVVPGPERNPLKEALKAVLDNPFVKPLIKLARAIGRLLRRQAP